MGLALPQLVPAQERVAAGSLQQEASWGALKSLAEVANGNAKMAQIAATSALDKANRIEACGKKGQLYAPDTAGADPVSGCKPLGNDNAVQVGTVVNTGSYTARNIQVTFAEPFTKVPRVHLALNRYVYHDNCREDKFDIEMGASSITKTGFKLTMGGYGRCGGQARVEKVMWVAVGR